MIFVKATIVNPAFDSQTKETLTTNVKKFGSKCEIDKAFIDGLVSKNKYCRKSYFTSRI